MDDRRILHGDCRIRLSELDPNSIDAVVTDPPYGLEFMGKEWDKLGGIIELQSKDTKSWHGVEGASGPFGGGGHRVRYGYSAKSAQEWHESWAREVLRVLKPGAHLIAFGGTRTYHRMVCALEDAGFEIRDCLMWIYGSGFPKSLDVSKAIDGVLGTQSSRFNHAGPHGKPMSAQDKSRRSDYGYRFEPTSDEAKRWQGWGTALKPAYEPIVLARKPLIGTVAANVQQFGTGAINVDGCRVALNAEAPPSGSGDRRNGAIYAQDAWTKGQMSNGGNLTPSLGRWPANLLHDGSEDVVALFPQTTSGACEGSSGSAARFFYCAKASRSERGEGNTHPTVKPQALLRYLIRLITPPHGLVLDPFAGSGSTALAALEEGCRFLGIEQDAGHTATADDRVGEAAFLPFGAANGA